MPGANLHLLRGDDQFSIKLYLNKIQESLGADFDPTMNLSRLDGKMASLEEIRTAITTLPFFGGSRLVIIDNMVNKVDKGRQDSFSELLFTVPPTTHLVLIVEDSQKWRRDGERWVQVWENFSPSHWLVKWFTSHAQAEIFDAALPDTRQMYAWVLNEVKRQGGKMDGAAANELSQHTGNDTSVASQEIAKLLLYVDFRRSVTREDVLELVSAEGLTDIFTMLDRLMEGRTAEAQAMMHRLLDDAQPEVLLGAVIHRFRQLLLLSEVLDNEEEIKVTGRKVGILPNKVEAYARAARRYSSENLQMYYSRLLDIDFQAKTSQVDLATNLELFVLEVND